LFDRLVVKTVLGVESYYTETAVRLFGVRLQKNNVSIIKVLLIMTCEQHERLSKQRVMFTKHKLLKNNLLSTVSAIAGGSNNA
jgi:hypothetical protein